MNIKKIVAISFTSILLVSGILAGTATACVYEGCTPGFWKNKLSEWRYLRTWWKIYGIFTIPDRLKSLRNYDLLEILSFKGGRGIEGAARILLKHAVAALLNAIHKDITYPLAQSEIIQSVNAALASLKRSTMLSLKDTLDYYNNLGCEGD